MKNVVIRIFLLSLLLTTVEACRDELEIYKIERLGVFSFSTDNITTSYANDVKFFHGKTTWYTYPDNRSEVYSRFLMEAKGKNAAGQDIVIAMEIEIIDDGTYVGRYTPVYEFGVGGIHTFSYLENLGNGQYKNYSLDPDFISVNFIQIERQQEEEKLILGNFFARLSNDQDVNDKITLYEGLFKDISYQLK